VKRARILGGVAHHPTRDAVRRRLDRTPPCVPSFAETGPAIQSEDGMPGRTG